MCQKNNFIKNQAIKLIQSTLISARTLFFNNLDKNKVKVIEDTDIAGLSVADLLRNPSNYPYYNQRGSDSFARVVERVLNNNNFAISIKTVQTLNITSYNQNTILRLKNVNSDFSQNYKDVIINGSKPVIMSGGIFSTLTTWEDNGKGLARELVNDGHDVWEIEMNGGDNTECSTCPDYTYQDQVDYFWPVLIAGVMNYSGKTQAHYIEHSNGCRVALSSLNSYSNGKNSVGYAFNSNTGLYDLNISLPNRSIDKFFGVACPVVVDGSSTFVDVARTNVIPTVGPKVGDAVMATITSKHISMFDYGWGALAFNQLQIYNAKLRAEFLFLVSLFSETDKISRNLMDYYNDLAISTSDTFSLSGVNVSAIYLYNGKFIPIVSEHDLLVPFADQEYILSNINVQNKTGSTIIVTDHSSIKSRVKDSVRRRLENG